MRRRSSATALILFAILMVGCGRPAGNSAESAAIAAIEKLGGKVEVDQQLPDKPVIKVYLHSTPVTDADLVHIAQLKQVQNIFLAKTQITDAGLEHLRDAHGLKTLGLNATAVTDGGLIHLTGLTRLKTLNLQDTKVTAAGAAALKRKLPGVTIAR